VGTPGGGFLRLLLRHRRPEDFIDESEHPGVLLVVEGADPETVSAYAAAIEQHVSGQGFTVAVCDLVGGEELVAGGPPVAPDGPEALETPGSDGQGATLRAAADLADLVNLRIRPELLRGSIVLTRDYIDGLVVRYGVQSGLSEGPVLRIMSWAVSGLRPDLTVVVDADPADVPVFAAAPTVATRSADAAAAAEDAFTAEVAGDVVQAFLGRASVAPGRYLVVAPLAAGGTLPSGVVERVESALRTRSPGRSVPPTDGMGPVDALTGTARGVGALG
jgi:dTMP kinase